MNEIKGPSGRGMPVVRWKNSLKEYMYERTADKRGELGLHKQGGSVWIEW